MSGVAGLLLAAGSSRRFGADKLTQAFPDETEWIAVRACRNLLAGAGNVTAVVRPESEALSAELRRLGADIVVCKNAGAGLSASIAAGVSASRGASGWLIALADMPWIAPLTIRAVADALRAGAGLAAPEFDGRRGHPVGFAAPFAQALIELRGDAGARDLLRTHAGDQVLIPVDDPGVLMDIDTPADLLNSRA